MKAVLVRIGIDHSYGGWNAPADPATGRFVYVPIPENSHVTFHPTCCRGYAEVVPALREFASGYGFDLDRSLKFPQHLMEAAMHLDPDFQHLTYGDVGSRRGSDLRTMTDGDLVVFYAGLRDVGSKDGHLIYAIIGLFVVDEVINAADVPKRRWRENAHTRKVKRGVTDIVVRAKPEGSGLLERFIPIGEFRDRAYRVRHDLLKAWGGLSVHDGYIQRSARPPRFLKSDRFYKWFCAQKVKLLSHNNWGVTKPKVILVHLRRPRRNNPAETRSDPCYEFGSFGCTRCHDRNLMHPKSIDDLAGARIGFAQGGPGGFRLVLLTPPVSVVRQRDRCEIRWKPVEPFRYTKAPLLVDNDGETDFPALLKLIQPVQRFTWMGKFSSAFRARRQPLPKEIAEDVMRTLDDRVAHGDPSMFAASYEEIMPYPPPRIDHDRAGTYKRLLEEATSGWRSRKSECTRPRFAPRSSNPRQATARCHVPRDVAIIVSICQGHQRPNRS